MLLTLVPCVSGRGLLAKIAWFRLMGHSMPKQTSQGASVVTTSQKHSSMSAAVQFSCVNHFACVCYCSICSPQSPRLQLNGLHTHDCSAPLSRLWNAESTFFPHRALGEKTCHIVNPELTAWIDSWAS